MLDQDAGLAPGNPEPAPAAGGDGAFRPFQRLDQCQAAPYSTSEYARRLLWQLVRGTLFRWSPARAFGWRRMLVRAFGGRIGSHVFIRRRCVIFHPWLLETGDWISLADGVNLYNLGAIRIGSHTTISQGSHLVAGDHDYTQPGLPLLRTPIEIGSGVWIAADAFIGPGARVEDNAVVGARAVVFGRVPAGMVVAGNPARVIKARPMGVRATPVDGSRPAAQ